MATITVKINARTKKTQHLLGLISEIAKHDKNVEIILPENSANSPYSKEFVKKIRRSEKQPGVKVDLENLWK